MTSPNTTNGRSSNFSTSSCSRKNLWLSRKSALVARQELVKFVPKRHGPTNVMFPGICHYSYSWQLCIYLRRKWRKRYCTYSPGIAYKCIWSLNIAESITTLHTKISIHAWSQLHYDCSKAHFLRRVSRSGDIKSTPLQLSRWGIIQVYNAFTIYIYISMSLHLCTVHVHMLASNCCFWCFFTPPKTL